MFKKSYLIVFLVALFCSDATAQGFLKPFDVVSKKKTAYLTLETGEEIECNIKKLKRAKKGLIKEIVVKIDGEKKTYKMEEIKFAYFPQSNWDKLIKFDDMLTDATQWEGDSPYELDRLKDGYAYFEKIDIILKGDERKLLMQQLNPYPGTRVKIYHDPQAGEKGGLSVGAIKVAKSQESNYYVSKDGEIADRLRKKDYKKSFKDLLGDCRKVEKEFGKKKKWSKFEDAIIMYNTECKE